MKLGDLYKQNKQKRIDLENKTERKVQYKALKYAMRDITRFIKEGSCNVGVDVSYSFFAYGYDEMLYKWLKRNKLKCRVDELVNNVYIQIIV